MEQPHTSESLNAVNPNQTPRTTYTKLGASALPAYMQDSTKIILSGSTECPLPPDVKPETFKQLFAETMRQGAAPESAPGEATRPRFFLPKTFITQTGLSINRCDIKDRTIASGIDQIVRAKNSPASISDPEAQAAAEQSLREYLDPQLFQYNFSVYYEVPRIKNLLGPETQADPMLSRLLDESTAQREEMQIRAREVAYRAEEDKYLEQKERDREELDRQEAIQLLQYSPTAPIAQVRNLLKNSPNKIPFERINALELWRERILEENPDAHLVECVRSFQPEPTIPGKPRPYSASDLYAVIAFDYAGHRCMIAECCNDQSQPSAAMKIWRGELDDPNGWEQMFTETKREANNQGLGLSLHHANLTAAVSARASHNPQPIVDAENKLFQKAFHYFKTGDFPK